MQIFSQAIQSNSLTPTTAFNSLIQQNDEAVLLHSASRDAYSFLCFNPFLSFQAKASNCKVKGLENYEKTANPFQELRLLTRKYADGFNCANSSFFTGGAVGLVGYDAGRLIEKLPELAEDDLQLPDFHFIFPKNIVVFDNKEKKIHLLALGEEKKAKQEIEGMKKKLSRAQREAESRKQLSRTRKVESMKKKISSARNEATHAREKNNLQFPRIPKIILSSNSSREKFEQAVEKAREYIRNGDIFQANLSHRFSGETTANPFDIYSALTRINPSPLAGFLQAREFQLLSCSPERLVKVEGRRIDARPIAGTRPRGKTRKEDELLMKELVENEKERAEHVMLVDLARNDLGRVSEFGSVKVNELMVVEKYSHVQHLVSNVQAKLEAGKDCFDVLQAVFPGGTITGAPKVRSMEVIEELEPTRRGPFYGSLGYISFDERMDFNILIRTILMKQKQAFVQVGAGIVADSNPKKEFEETMHKAQAMLNAVNANAGVY
ncbi:anthranilate synthase component I family protein [Candidatus Micrarchaeota archaeon]|nr:anthranilate synthase component I family protein [Candidatus Micrarchaeota archaeon]